MPDQAPVIVTPQGRPARAQLDRDRRCPACGAGPEKRVASGGFGAPHPVCKQCGHEWRSEQMES